VTPFAPGEGLLVRAPVPGRALPLRQVPDPTFAGGLVGPGAALDPPPGRLDAVAPVGGLLVKVHPHAFVIQPEGGPAILVHLGIDTVQLRGDGFTVRGEEGAEVEPGDVVVTWDPSAVTAGGRSPVCPVVALDVEAVALADAVERGDPLPALAPLFTVPLAVPISPL
jgi:sugar PTS system EIIA component